MKKPITAITLLLALALLAGCGQVYRPAPMDQPRYTITDGAYDVTPDQLVTDLLAARETVKTIDFEPVAIPMPSDTEPNFEGTYRLSMYSGHLRLSLDTTDDGRVSSITVHWQGSSDDAQDAVLIILCLLRMFVPTDIDTTISLLDSAMAVQSDRDVVNDGSIVTYLYHADLANNLTVKPAEA